MGLNKFLVLGLIFVLVFGCLEFLPSRESSLQPPVNELNAALNEQNQNANNSIQNTNQNTQNNSNQNSTQFNSSVHRVKGTAKNEFPFGETTTDFMGYKIIDFKGGVVEAMLSENVKLFVIVPKEEVIQEAGVMILPFTELPAGEMHLELNDELGFGALIEFESLQQKIKYYAVFDLTGGEATKELRGTELFNRCSPESINFNPLICSKKNNALKEEVKDYAVVTPIFLENEHGLVLTRKIIPLGLKDLIAVEMKNESILLPQKLDQQLASELTAKVLNRRGNSEEQAEAVSLALNWRIPLTITQTENGLEALEQAETYPELIQTYLLSKKMKTDLIKLESASDFEDDWEYVMKWMNDLTQESSENIYSNAESDSQRSHREDSVEAGAATGFMSSENTEGAQTANETVQENYNETINDSDSSAEEAMNAGEGIEVSEGTPATSIEELINDVINNPNSSTAELMQAWALAQGLGLDTPEMEAKVKAKIMDDINEIIDNPNATIPELLNALALAQQLGLDSDELTQKIMDKIRDRINKILEDGKITKKEALELAALSQLLGFDDLAEKAFNLFYSLQINPECEVLVKKDLSNYGKNDCR
ncbi:MAG: hypothetical protein JW703_02820 [Candidatus Diapherotrites archaeon]|nr:hypothetical protein [Candidatus Diapherotrites archaeon]